MISFLESWYHVVAPTRNASQSFARLFIPLWQLFLPPSLTHAFPAHPCCYFSGPAFSSNCLNFFPLCFLHLGRKRKACIMHGAIKTTFLRLLHNKILKKLTAQKLAMHLASHLYSGSTLLSIILCSIQSGSCFSSIFIPGGEAVGLIDQLGMHCNKPDIAAFWVKDLQSSLANLLHRD